MHAESNEHRAQQQQVLRHPGPEEGRHKPVPCLEPLGPRGEWVRYMYNEPLCDGRMAMD